MSIWPWRSRPVVTPFDSNFSARVITMATNVAANTFTWQVPDNLYLHPTSFCFQWDTGGGIRGVDYTTLAFYRGALVYSAVIGALLTNNQNIHQVFATDAGQRGTLGLFDLYTTDLPSGIYCYPNDTIIYRVPSWQAADVLNYAVMHAKVWEVH